MKNILNNILEHYYTYTEQGRRERALNIDAISIQLTPDFPYYSDGIRGVEYDSLNDIAIYYIDLYFVKVLYNLSISMYPFNY